jgi:rod shape-determining protein MreC
VGRVVRGADGGWRVRLASDAAPVDFVRVLLFEDFVKLEDLRVLNRPSPPPPPTPTPRAEPPAAATAPAGQPRGAAP